MNPFTAIACLGLMAMICLTIVPGIKAAKEGHDVIEWTDPTTGCIYLRDGRGMTPKLGADSVPLCRETLAPVAANELPACVEGDEFPCTEGSAGVVE